MADSRTFGSNTRIALSDFLQAQERGATDAELQDLQRAFEEARTIEDDPSPRDSARVLLQVLAAERRGAPAEVQESLKRKFEAARALEAGSALDPNILARQIRALRAQGAGPDATAPLEAQEAAAVERAIEGQKIVTDPVLLFRLWQETPADGSALLARRREQLFEAARTEPVDSIFLTKVYRNAARRRSPAAPLYLRRARASERREVAAAEAPGRSTEKRKALDDAVRRGASPILVDALRRGLERQIAAEGAVLGRSPSAPPKASRDLGTRPARPSLLRDLVTGAVLTSPAWLTLLVLRRSA